MGIEFRVKRLARRALTRGVSSRRTVHFHRNSTISLHSISPTTKNTPHSSKMIDTEHIAQTEPESAEPEAVEPQITRFDNAGDLRLLVWDQTPEAVQRVFIVSSKAMSMACVAWNSMLNGSFKEAQPTSGEREVELPDDDPAALEVLLNIAHLRFDWVPSWLYFNVLLQVTVLTDKYDMTRLIRPWATSWFQTAQRLVSVTQSGYEEWLWIAWELGQTHTFETLATHLVKSVRVDNNGNCTTNTGKLLDPCRSTGQQFPPGIIGMSNIFCSSSLLWTSLAN